ncbi:thioredoxin domain-containing protein [Verrucomicrobia bacterium]|nr:thioredoxin domain-containing protein [Verrucomicrobiota bacterium]
MKFLKSIPLIKSVISFLVLLTMVGICLLMLMSGVMTMKGIKTQAAAPPMSMNHTNRLAGQKSPYLLQHAHNPVDWYPWGDEAFKKAREENKMIFLSVGYSTCHWCHVMAHESFENEDIAKVLNAYFVCVKVDREERPDVDKIYMTFVQATTGSGGWPMSVWLTPDLKPVVGGTYFPPARKFGRPGFPDICMQIGEAWKQDQKRLIESGNDVLKRLREVYSGASSGARPLSKAMLDQAYARIASQYDDENKGFGAAPKFPRPVTFNFLLRHMHHHGRTSGVGSKALSMTLETLKTMARGGIHDHLGGGFHRYAVDKQWHVPHFEKMLYDQAQLAMVYLDAFQITGEKNYADTARDILDYVLRDMTHDQGGFYSAEDADSLVEHGKADHAEGAFYVWTADQIKQELGETHAAWFNAMYGIELDGNAPLGSDPQGEFKDKNILIQRRTVSEVAARFKQDPGVVAKALMEARNKLKSIRDQRPRPHLDDKVIASWNGLMISAFAKAGQILDDGQTYASAAVHAASFIHDHLYDPSSKTLFRIHRGERSNIEGFLDDHAFLIQGLIDLYETTFDIRWLKWAATLQARQDDHFWDAEHGGYFATRAETADILLRIKDDYDGAEPSANSISIMNLLRLHHSLGDPQFLRKAETSLQHFSTSMSDQPSGMPQMLAALSDFLHPARQVVFASDPSDAKLREMQRLLHQHFFPGKVVLLADGAQGQAFLGRHLEFIESVSRIDNQTTAYVCENYVCQRPTNVTDVFAKLLKP